MRCFSRKQLESYALETARTGKARPGSLAAHPAIEQHLQDCKSCRNKVAQMRIEQRELERLLYEEALDPSFTAGVMEAIAAEKLGEQTADMTPRNNEIRRKDWRKNVLVGAASLLLIGGGSWYALEQAAPQVPDSEKVGQERASAADRIKRLLHDPSGKWEWTKHAIAYDKAGLIQYPGIELSDKTTGYRMEVLALLSDGLTATLILRISDQDGNPVNSLISPASFAWRDEAGEPAANYNFSSVGESGTAAFTYALNPDITGSVKLSGDVFGMNVSVQGREEIRFAKPLSFEQTIELRSARQHTMTILPSDMVFKLQDGIRMELLRLSRTPVQLQIAARFWMPEDEKNGGENSDMTSGRSMNFHIEDEQGNVLERFGENLTYELAGSIQDFHSGPEGNPMRAVAWTYPLQDPVGLDKPLKLVFDSVSLPVNASDEVSFRPSELSPKHPAKLTSGGDRFVFTQAEIKQMNGDSLLEIPYTVNLVNEDVGTWEAVDGSSTRYTAIVPQSASGTRMRIFGIDKMPAELTLRRTVFAKTYDHLGISFDVPAVKQPPTLTSGK